MYIHMIMFLCIYVVVIEPYFRNLFCKWPLTNDLPFCQNKSWSWIWWFEIHKHTQ